MKHWVILGAGNLVGDIVEATQESGDRIWGLVCNQPLNEIVATKLAKKKIYTIDLPTYLDTLEGKTHKDAPARSTSNIKKVPAYPWLGTSHIFGFVDPKKQELLEILAPYNLNFDNLIHPRASISPSLIMGVGNYFGSLSVVGSDARVGDHNFINRAASIGHDTQIGSFNRFGPSATICGRCCIEDRCYIGANATVIDGLRIESDVVVGAGAVATKNLLKSGTYVGIPARLMPSL